MLQLLPLLYPQVALCGFWVADDVTRWVSCVEYLPGRLFGLFCVLIFHDEETQNIIKQCQKFC